LKSYGNIKAVAKFLLETVRRLLHGNGTSQEHFQRCHGSVADAAGDDGAEVGHVGGDVQGDSVKGSPAADADADRGDFCPADPYTSQSFDALTFQAVIGEQIDEHRLQASQI